MKKSFAQCIMVIGILIPAIGTEKLAESSVVTTPTIYNYSNDFTHKKSKTPIQLKATLFHEHTYDKKSIAKALTPFETETIIFNPQKSIHSTINSSTLIYSDSTQEAPSAVIRLNPKIKLEGIALNFLGNLPKDLFWNIKSFCSLLWYKSSSSINYTVESKTFHNPTISIEDFLEGIFQPNVLPLQYGKFFKGIKTTSIGIIGIGTECPLSKKKRGGIKIGFEYNFPTQNPTTPEFILHYQHDYQTDSIILKASAWQLLLKNYSNKTTFYFFSDFEMRFKSPYYAKEILMLKHTPWAHYQLGQKNGAPAQTPLFPLGNILTQTIKKAPGLECKFKGKILYKHQRFLIEGWYAGLFIEQEEQTLSIPWINNLYALVNQNISVQNYENPIKNSAFNIYGAFQSARDNEIYPQAEIIINSRDLELHRGKKISHTIGGKLTILTEIKNLNIEIGFSTKFAHFSSNIPKTYTFFAGLSTAL